VVTALVRGAAAVAGVMAVRLVAGVWITAVAVAGLAVVGLVAGWAAIERRAFPRRPAPPAPVPVGPRAPGRAAGDGTRHVAFARALSTVAAAYLAECERDQRQEPDDDRG
jgi:hypothetical protein